MAVERGYVEVVRLLLDHGADVQTSDDFGSTPLHIASSVGKIQTVQLLLENDVNVHTLDKDGRTALDVVVEKAMSCEPPNYNRYRTITKLLRDKMSP